MPWLVVAVGIAALLFIGMVVTERPRIGGGSDPLRVLATCPANVKLLPLPILRIRNPQYAKYLDQEIAAVLVELCYPAEDARRVVGRLDDLANQRIGAVSIDVEDGR